MLDAVAEHMGRQPVAQLHAMAGAVGEIAGEAMVVRRGVDDVAGSRRIDDDVALDDEERGVVVEVDADRTEVPGAVGAAVHAFDDVVADRVAERARAETVDRATVAVDPHRVAHLVAFDQGTVAVDADAVVAGLVDDIAAQDRTGQAGDVDRIDEELADGRTRGAAEAHRHPFDGVAHHQRTGAEVARLDRLEHHVGDAVVGHHRGEALHRNAPDDVVQVTVAHLGAHAQGAAQIDGACTVVFELEVADPNRASVPDADHGTGVDHGLDREPVGLLTDRELQHQHSEHRFVPPFAGRVEQRRQPLDVVVAAFAGRVDQSREAQRRAVLAQHRRAHERPVVVAQHQRRPDQTARHRGQRRVGQRPDGARVGVEAADIRLARELLQRAVDVEQMRWLRTQRRPTVTTERHPGPERPRTGQPRPRTGAVGRELDVFVVALQQLQTAPEQVAAAEQHAVAGLDRIAGERLVDAPDGPPGLRRGTPVATVVPVRGDMEIGGLCRGGGGQQERNQPTRMPHGLPPTSECCALRSGTPVAAAGNGRRPGLLVTGNGTPAGRGSPGIVQAIPGEVSLPWPPPVTGGAGAVADREPITSHPRP